MHTQSIYFVFCSCTCTAANENENMSKTLAPASLRDFASLLAAGPEVDSHCTDWGRVYRSLKGLQHVRWRKEVGLQHVGNRRSGQSQAAHVMCMYNPSLLRWVVRERRLCYEATAQSCLGARTALCSFEAAGNISSLFQYVHKTYCGLSSSLKYRSFTF